MCPRERDREEGANRFTCSEDIAVSLSLSFCSCSLINTDFGSKTNLTTIWQTKYEFKTTSHLYKQPIIMIQPNLFELSITHVLPAKEQRDEYQISNSSTDTEKHIKFKDTRSMIDIEIRHHRTSHRGLQS